LQLFTVGQESLHIQAGGLRLVAPIIVDTIIKMDIEFDPAKDTLNQAKHGIGLAVAQGFDMDTALVVPDAREKELCRAKGQIWILNRRRCPPNGLPRRVRQKTCCRRM
jgi:hypothetical protein